jgi:hypothetical protein
LTPAAELSPQQILERLGVATAPPREQKRTVAELAFSGRLPLAWLRVMRQAGFLPYDLDKDD